MSNSKISQWVRPEIQALNAYFVPEPGKLIKLDNMENPYTWQDDLKNAWLERIKDVELNRYPDADAKQLKQTLKSVMAVPETAELILGNGSDELIQMVCMALAKPGSSVLSLNPTFVMYKMIALFTGMSYHSVDLNEDFTFPVEAMLEAIKKYQPAVSFISYPNNPTGNLFPESAICQVIEQSPGLVVIDEAYHSFAGDSFIKHLRSYDNVVIMRTVSKMGLAGLRLGYMMGSADWINEFNKVRLPFNINCLTQASAIFALEQQAVFDRQTQQIKKDRETLFEKMQSLQGISCYPSAANFILFKTKPGAATPIFERLKAAGILIKNLSVNGGMLTDCLRVTVGKPDENNVFINALQEILND